MSKMKSAALLGLVAVVGSPAFAAIDVTAATTGISDASTALVTVFGALITMGAALFGLKKIKRVIGG